MMGCFRNSSHGAKSFQDFGTGERGRWRPSRLAPEMANGLCSFFDDGGRDITRNCFTERSTAAWLYWRMGRCGAVPALSL